MILMPEIDQAESLVLQESRQLLESIQSIAMNAPTTPEQAIRALSSIRSTIYESLNQLQHEYLIVLAAKWLKVREPFDHRAKWGWNPRQTGGGSEPDLAVDLNGVRLISAEATTSLRPQGTIDTRMASTLQKLGSMSGQKYYFVRTEEMRQRAATKIEKLHIDVVAVCIAIP